eukprot:PhF_6_TR11262/c0_g1_i1/m.18166
MNQTHVRQILARFGTTTQEDEQRWFRLCPRRTRGLMALHFIDSEDNHHEVSIVPFDIVSEVMEIVLTMTLYINAEVQHVPKNVGESKGRGKVLELSNADLTAKVSFRCKPEGQWCRQGDLQRIEGVPTAASTTTSWVSGAPPAAVPDTTTSATTPETSPISPKTNEKHREAKKKDCVVS